jgi:hypothetical protein
MDMSQTFPANRIQLLDVAPRQVAAMLRFEQSLS